MGVVGGGGGGLEGGGAGVRGRKIYFESKF